MTCNGSYWKFWGKLDLYIRETFLQLINILDTSVLIFRVKVE